MFCLTIEMSFAHLPVSACEESRYVLRKGLHLVSNPTLFGMGLEPEKILFDWNGYGFLGMFMFKQ